MNDFKINERGIVENPIIEKHEISLFNLYLELRYGKKPQGWTYGYWIDFNDAKWELWASGFGCGFMDHHFSTQAQAKAHALQFVKNRIFEEGQQKPRVGMRDLRKLMARIDTAFITDAPTLF